VAARRSASRSTMKIIVACVIALTVVQITVVAGLDTDIPQTNRVILKTGQWTPSEKDVEKALVAIQAYLETPSRSTNVWTSREIKEILTHAKDYRVQFKGVVLAGRKVIHCLFLSGSDPDPYALFCDPRTGKCLRYLFTGFT